MTRSLYGLLALGIVLTTASLPLHGQGDPCAGNLSVSPTSLQYNAQGSPVTPFTVTASPACTWFFRYLDGDSFILPQSYGTGTVVFDLTLNPLLGSPNHLSTTKTEHFRVGSLQTTSSATVTATQDPALTMSMSCPKAPNPVIWACTGSVGAPFSASAIATGGKSPYRTSTDQFHLPTGLPLGLSRIGLTLNPSTGIISGTPTAGGSFSLPIYMMDADGAVTAALVDIDIASDQCNYMLSGPAVVPGLSRYTYQIDLPADNNARGIAWSASTSTASITPKYEPTGVYIAFQNVKPDWVTLEAKFTLDKKPECAMKQVAVVKVAVDTPSFTTQGKAAFEGDGADFFQLNPPAPPQPSDWVIYHDPGSAWQAFTYKDCVAHPATCKQAAEPSKPVSSRAGGYVSAFQADTKVTLTSPPEMPTAQQKIQVGFVQHGLDDGSAVYDHNAKLVRTLARPTSHTVDWLAATAGPGANDDWPWYNKLTARQTGAGSNSWSTRLTYTDSPTTTFPAEYNPNNQVPERHKKIETAKETMFFIVRMAARTLDSTLGADHHYFSEGEATWTVKYVWPVVENVGITKVGPNPWAAPTVPNEINVNAVPMNININIPYARWTP